MPGLMKKLHTDAVLIFVGPEDKAKEAKKAMRVLGFRETGETAPSEEAIPWRESKHFCQPEKWPSMTLAGARCREGLTQAQLAERTGIQRRHISEMENGKRPIGKTNAKKLGEVLQIDPRRLLTV